MAIPWREPNIPRINERYRLLDRMSQLAGRVLAVEYLYSHELEVLYTGGRSTRVAISDWMSDECLARIALECP